MIHQPILAGPCRVCGKPAYSRDDTGPAHSCCLIHGDPCPACAASEKAGRDQDRRTARRRS